MRRALIVVLAFAATSVLNAQPGDEQQIRARRELSNQAIARHDTAGVGAIFAGART